MTLPISLPFLFALGIRIGINLLNPDHSPTTSDHLLTGFWQGVLLYHFLVHLSDFAPFVGIAIVAKLCFDVTRPHDDTFSKASASLIGIVLGVLMTNVVSQFYQEWGFGSEFSSSKERTPSTSRTHPVLSSPKDVYEPSRRLRLVSFGKSNPDRQRSSRPHTDSHPQRHKGKEPDLAVRDIISPAPTGVYSIDTQPSISIDSCPSSIDPEGKMSPAEREIALLRARASLADSERRRFKEERKWALSEGNKARAHQLSWQVKRYTSLMESYTKEADSKLIEVARATAPMSSVPFPQPVAGPSTSAVGMSSSSRRAVSNPIASTSQRTSRQAHTSSSNQPLVSVTIGTAKGVTPPRARKRSGGATSGSGLKPAMYVPSGPTREFLVSRR